MSGLGEAIAPGVYFGLSEEVYHSAPGLSCSGMKDLAVSPLHYWHRNLNPAAKRPKETDAQRFGRAVHCRLLEPARFSECYGQKLSKADYPAALVTVEDMKAWLAAKGLPTSAKRKEDLIERIAASGHQAVIWDAICQEYAASTEGKILLDKEDMSACERIAALAVADPFVSDMLSDGMPEISFFVPHPESGVLLKARVDYVKTGVTLDLKTFTNSRGKPIQRTINEALFHERYYVQCVFYSKVREIARQLLAEGRISAHGEVSKAWLQSFIEFERHGFGFVFAEADEPHYLEIVEMMLAEVVGADANVYWLDAELVISERIRVYSECVAKYEGAPWRDTAPVRLLEDSDIPQLLFHGGGV